MQIRYQFIRKHISSVCIKAFWKTLYVIGIVSAFIRCTMCVQHKIRRRRTWKICFMQCDFGSFAHLLAAVPWDFLSFSFSIAWNEHWACGFCPYRELILFLFFYFSLFLFRSSYFLCMQSILLFSFRHSSDWWLPSNRTKKKQTSKTKQSNHLSSVRFVDFAVQLECSYKIVAWCITVCCLYLQIICINHFIISTSAFKNAFFRVSSFAFQRIQFGFHVGHFHRKSSEILKYFRHFS